MVSEPSEPRVPGEPGDPLALAELLDDLEALAEASFHADREDELTDRSRSEYLQVTLASRLMAEVDREVGLDVLGVGAVHGTLQRVATGWLVLRVHRADWLIRHEAVIGVRGVGVRSVPEVAWPLTARLGFSSALRRLADLGTRCALHLVDGSTSEGIPARVGADFVELSADDGSITLLALAAVAAVRHA